MPLNAFGFGIDESLKIGQLGGRECAVGGACPRASRRTTFFPLPDYGSVPASKYHAHFLGNATRLRLIAKRRAHVSAGPPLRLLIAEISMEATAPLQPPLQPSLPDSLPPPPQPADAPSLRQIFTAFTIIALSSFGGGLSGWMLRELVQRRKWLTEESFMNGLGIAQAFPGVNVVNLSIWIGYQLRGTGGALVASLGMVVPPMFVAIGTLTLFEALAEYPVVRIAVAGVAAGAIGLAFNMGLRALYRSARSVAPALVALSAFLAIFVFQIPLYIVVGVLAPLSIALSYRRLINERKRARDAVDDQAGGEGRT